MLYELIEKFNEDYEIKTNSLFSNDDIEISGKGLLNDGSSFGGKMKIQKQEVGKPVQNKLAYSSEIYLNKKINDCSKIILNQIGNQINFYGEYKLFNNKLTINPKFSLENNEKVSNFPISAIIKYQISKCALMSFGLENFEYYKSKLPGILSANIYYGKCLGNGRKIGGEANYSYNLREKFTNMFKLGLSFTNNSFRSLINFKINRIPSELIEKEEESYKKSIIFKSINEINEKLTIGGDAIYNINDKNVVPKIFSEYKIDENKEIKGKWEKKTLSFSFNSYYLHKLLRFGVNGRLISVRKDESCQHIYLPPFKTKFGFSVDIDENRMIKSEPKKEQSSFKNFIIKVFNL